MLFCIDLFLTIYILLHFFCKIFEKLHYVGVYIIYIGADLVTLLHTWLRFVMLSFTALHLAARHGI